MIKKYLFLLLTLGFLSTPAFSQRGPDPSYKFNTSVSWTQLKNYHLLTLFEQDAAVAKFLAADPELAKLTESHQKAIEATLECKNMDCFLVNSKFTDAEISLVSHRLKALYHPGNSLALLVQNKLIPSGMYIIYKEADPADLLVKAWEQDAAGMNHTIDVYAGGKSPNYPQIDSISFNVHLHNYTSYLYNEAVVINEEAKNSKLFFEPTMQAALFYLQVNDRKDPDNYEPMEHTVNKLAVEAIKTTQWKNYPYNVLLVPGGGPDDLITELTAGGVIRCRLAAQQWLKHEAPYIIVSGGKVHPYKTKFCEAEEMKKFLVETLHIPASAIIMDPHARHTTTNMRNASRLMFRYGIPLSKPGLVISDRSQTHEIIIMAERCMRELKYVPYKLGKQVSTTMVEFYGVTDALQINADEPLDP